LNWEPVFSFIHEAVSSKRHDRRELETRERIAEEQRAAQQQRDPGAPPPPARY
jgi:hypothetical protein